MFKPEPKYYNGNPNLKAAGVQYQYSLDDVKEFVKCSKEPLYFINNYVKVVSLDGGLVPFKTYPYQDRVIMSIHNNRFTIGKIFRQSGKQLALDYPIPTPTGFKLMKDIHVGDYVLGSNGKPVKVTFESVPESKPYYKITFNTGEVIECCEDHLWTVYDKLFSRDKVINDGKVKYINKKITASTKELYQRGFKKLNNRGYEEFAYYIPNTKPVDLKDEDIRIDPYCLGLWLGDGFSSCNKIALLSNIRQQYEKAGAKFVSDYCYVDPNHPNLINLKFDESTGLTTNNLNYYNLKTTYPYDGIKTKHIPSQYIFSSKQTKIRLLQGLMDTDGWVDKDHGTCYLQFSRKYDKLIQSTCMLLNALGLKYTTKDFEKTNSRRISFMVALEDFQPCNLEHKLKYIHQTYIRPIYVKSRIITNIEPLNENRIGKCIQVDSEDHLYLCGENFLPTHNTTCTAAYCLWYAVFNEMKNVFILANKQSTAREILSRIQQQYEDLPDFLKPGIKEYNKLSIVFDNGSKIKCAATTVSAIRGQSVNLLLIDEFAFIPEEMAQGFITSVFPTLSSSKESKLVLISTPNGFNTYYNIWHSSELGQNDFVRIEGNWEEIHPKSWYLEQCKLLGDPVKIRQEIECVSEDALVEVYDKSDQKYKKIPIKQLYDNLE